MDPATLRIVASDASKTYGNVATLTGYSVSGLVNADSVSGVTLGSSGASTTADVGRYAINASNAIGSGLGNYTIAYVDGVLTVLPAEDGVQLPASTVQAINQAVAVTSTGQEADSVHGDDQSEDHIARELAAAAQAEANDDGVTAFGIQVIDGGVRVPTPACTASGTSAISSAACLRQ